MHPVAAALLVVGIFTVVTFFSIKYLVLEGESYRELFKSFFDNRSADRSQVLVMDDPDFGTIRYDEPSEDGESGYWQMDDNWKDTTFSSASIPGSTSGPHENARKFILDKFNSEEELWSLCSAGLKSAAQDFIRDLQHKDVKDVFFLSCISTDTISVNGDHEWEVCFETRDDYKWLYIGLQIQRGEVVSNFVDT